MRPPRTSRFVDVDRACADEHGREVWRLKRERAVRPVSVVVGGVEVEHLLKVAAVDDQQPVEALAAKGADPTLGIRIRIRSSDRPPDDPHALAAEHVVEGAAELTVAIVKQKAKGLVAVAQGASAGCAPCCATQRPSGLLVLATNSIRRRSSETKKRT
jgi:hypothetical protein